MAFSLERRRAKLLASMRFIDGHQKNDERNYNNQKDQLINSEDTKTVKKIEIIAKNITSEYF